MKFSSKWCFSLPGMDVCRYFEVDCDNELEDCQQIYLNKWLPAPAQYQCSCKEGLKRHPTRKCIRKCINKVNFRNWLWNRANFKGTNKDHKIYVGRSTTLHNLLVFVHTLSRLNCVTVTFLLVSSSGTNHDLLCFVDGHGQIKRKKKHKELCKAS